MDSTHSVLHTSLSRGNSIAAILSFNSGIAVLPFQILNRGSVAFSQGRCAAEWEYQADRHRPSAFGGGLEDTPNLSSRISRESIRRHDSLVIQTYHDELGHPCVFLSDKQRRPKGGTARAAFRRSGGVLVSEVFVLVRPPCPVQTK